MSQTSFAHDAYRSPSNRALSGTSVSRYIVTYPLLLLFTLSIGILTLAHRSFAGYNASSLVQELGWPLLSVLSVGLGLFLGGVLSAKKPPAPLIRVGLMGAFCVAIAALPGVMGAFGGAENAVSGRVIIWTQVFLACLGISVIGAPLIMSSYRQTFVSLGGTAFGITAALAVFSASEVGNKVSAYTERAVLEFCVLTAVASAVWVADRFAANRASGVSVDRAVQLALVQALPVSVFFGFVAFIGLFVPSLAASPDRSLFDSAQWMLLVAFVSPLTTIVAASAVLSACGEWCGDVSSYYEARARFSLLSSRFRQYSGRNVAIAVSASLLVLAVATKVDLTVATLNSATLVALLTAFAMGISFFSLRAAILFATHSLVLMFIATWFLIPFEGNETPFVVMRLIAMSALLIGPFCFFWREARDPWKNSRDVTVNAVSGVGSVALTSLSAFVALMTIIHYTNGGGLHLVETLQFIVFAICAYASLVYWSIAYGAILGRR
ncbi:MAG: hypothetical protein AAF668_12870 [Pseudomonadota bacterium]